jgi:hypothetical protein
MADTAQFWFNTTTGKVEEGRVSDWSQVLGPYPTREAAAHALATARARSQEWDRQDRADREWATPAAGSSDEDSSGTADA